MADSVIITQGKYLVSAVKKEQYPEIKRKEIVFTGRSNVGKSSLINSLTRVKNLARVSSQPGKTQTINFYELGAKIENENTASDVAEQLSRINEQLAIKNRRSRRIWKIVAIILAAIILINIFIAVFFSVPTLNEGIQSNQPEIIDQTQIIEE